MFHEKLDCRIFLLIEKENENILALLTVCSSVICTWIPSNPVFYDAVFHMTEQHMSTATPVLMNYFSLKGTGGTGR